MKKISSQEKNLNSQLVSAYDILIIPKEKVIHKVCEEEKM